MMSEIRWIVLAWSVPFVITLCFMGWFTQGPTVPAWVVGAMALCEGGGEHPPDHQVRVGEPVCFNEAEATVTRVYSVTLIDLTQNDMDYGTVQYGSAPGMWSFIVEDPRPRPKGVYR